MTAREPFKYTFEVDEKEKTVSFAGEVWSYYVSFKNVPDLKGCRRFLKGAKLPAGTVKDFSKSFTEHYGITPTAFKRVFNKIMRDLWITPVEEWAMQYGFSCTGKPQALRLVHIHKHLDKLDQAKADGIENVAPLILATGKTPEELKKEFGKSLWKRLCKNSKSRNRHLSRVCILVSGHSDGRYGARVESLQRLPSAILKKGGNFQFFGNEDITAYFIKQGVTATSLIKGRGKWSGKYRTLADTRRMARQLNLPISWDWSYEKWEEKHDEYTEITTAGKFSKEPYEALEGIPKVLVECGFTAKLLQSPYAMQTEGKKMHHCIASYSGQVERGGYVAYHVEDEHGVESTLGIPLMKKQHIKGKLGVGLMQHLGHCNKTLKNPNLVAFHKKVKEKIAESLNKELISALEYDTLEEENIGDLLYA